MCTLKNYTIKYVLKRHKNSDNQKRFNESACEKDFIAGVKSKAAKEYWMKKLTNKNKNL